MSQQCASSTCLYQVSVSRVLPRVFTTCLFIGILQLKKVINYSEDRFVSRYAKDLNVFELALTEFGHPEQLSGK